MSVRCGACCRSARACTARTSFKCAVVVGQGDERAACSVHSVCARRSWARGQRRPNRQTRHASHLFAPFRTFSHLLAPSRSAPAARA
eukprot:6143187-Pleurochrysis_carterae.AAC.1